MLYTQIKHILEQHETKVLHYDHPEVRSAVQEVRLAFTILDEQTHMSPGEALSLLRAFTRSVDSEH